MGDDGGVASEPAFIALLTGPGRHADRRRAARRRGRRRVGGQRHRDRRWGGQRRWPRRSVRHDGRRGEGLGEGADRARAGIRVRRLFGAGGTREYVWRMTGTWVPPAVAAPGRLTIRRTVRCGTTRLPVLRATRLELVAGEGDAAGTRAMPGATSFGTCRTGNRADGSATSGTGTTVAGGSTTDLIAAPSRLAYGRARATRPRTPNRNRFRRDLNMPQLAEGRATGRGACICRPSCQPITSTERHRGRTARNPALGRASRENDQISTPHDCTTPPLCLAPSPSAPTSRRPLTDRRQTRR